MPVTVDGQTFTKTIAWSVNRTGAQGTPGAQVSLTATAQVLTVPVGGGAATSPATSTVTGSAVNTTISVWEYAVDGGAFAATVPAGVSRTGNVVTITGATMTARTIAVRMADAAGVADTLTVAEVADGATGGPGADAYTVLLTNEAHIFPGTTTAAIAGSTTSQVIAYKGAVQQVATIGTITGQVAGLTTAITNNGTATATVTITVTTALTTQGGTLTVPVTVDGRSFTKTVAWSVGRTGAQGVAGAQVSLTATAQVLTVPVAGGATAPATSTITGTGINTTITVWEYSADGAAFAATVPAGVARTGNVVTITGATMTARTIAVRMADAAGVADTLTVAKVADGATGGQGDPGADAYTVLLTNEAHIFPGSTTAALAGSTTSQVIAYKGAVQQVATIGTITGQVAGLTTAVTNNGTATATVTITVTTALVTQGGTLTVPVTVDGRSFTKTIAWSVGRTGAQGVAGAQVSLTATAQVLTSPAGGGATTPATSTITGTGINTTITVWEYSADGAAFSATVPAGASRTGNVVTITGATMTARTIAVRMADAAGVADTLTVADVSDGGPGQDAYTVVLTNEAHTFPGSVQSALAGSTTSQVIAYKGAVQQVATIGTITGQVAGLTTAITNNGTTTATVTITVTTSLVAQGGTLTVPVTVDGRAFTKTIAWSVSRTGSTGGQGTSVTSITPYYAQVATTAAVPTKPTTATPVAPWTATQPNYVRGTRLYQTDKVTFSDATFAYTNVTQSSIYDAIAVAVTDGIVPSTSPTPTVISGLGSILLRWTGVTNADPVTYRVYGSKVSGFTADATTLLGEVAGTSMTVRRLNGVPTSTYDPTLSYDMDAYFKIIAVDGDGPSGVVGAQVAGRPTRATGGDIAFETVRTEHMVAGSITGDLFSGEVVLGSKISTGSIDTNEASSTYGQVVGQRVDLSPEGIELIDAAGNSVVTIPIDPNRAAFFKGGMETSELRVLGGTSIESKTNEIAKDAALALSAGVSNPVSTPTMAFDYEKIKLDTTTSCGPIDPAAGDLGTFSLNPAQIEFLAYSPFTGGWMVAQRRAGGFRIWHFLATGAIELSAGKPRVNDRRDWLDVRGLWGTTANAGFGVVFRWSGGGYWVENGIDSVSPISQFPDPVYANQRPIYTLDTSTGYIVAAENRHAAGDKFVNLKHFRIDAGGLTLMNQYNSAAGLSASAEFAGMVRGTTMSGIVGQKYVWAYFNSAFKTGVSTVHAGAAMDTNEQWDVENSPLGFSYDGVSFWSVDSTGYLTKYSAFKWTDAANRVYAAISWYDDDLGGTPSPPTNNGRHETLMGAKASMVMRKRARIRVTLPAVPDKGGVDDPNKWRLYMLRAVVTPGDAAMIYQTEGGSPSSSTTVILASLATSSGVAAPTINNFPGASPAELKATKINEYGREAFFVDGEGGGYWDRLLPCGAITMWPVSAPPAGWLTLDGTVKSRSAFPALFAVLGTSFNTGGELATDFRLPDMRSRFPIGAGTFTAVGGGDASGEAARTPAHSHGTSNLTVTTATNTSGGGALTRVTGISGQTNDSGKSAIPYLGLNFIIKT